MMNSSDEKKGVLATLSKQYSQGKKLSPGDMSKLLSLCKDPHATIRETALLLLLHPPLSHEILHYCRLMRHLPQRLSTVSQFPEPVIELFCEIAGFLERIPHGSPSEDFLIHLLRNLPVPTVRMIFEKSFPLKPFLLHLSPKSFGWMQGGTSLHFKRRWRLLRKRLLQETSPPLWAQLTTFQLSPLWQTRASCGRWKFSKGRWHTVGRVLLLPPDEALPSHRFSASLPLYRAYWGGRGNRSLRYLETLLQHQTEELRSIRELAHEVSRKTRRVVLSWHNATLAASGGWAFESLNRQFPSHTLWENFLREIQGIQQERREPSHSLEHLRKLREKRLISPKLLHSLWESRVRMTLDVSRKGQWRNDLRKAKACLDPESLSQMLRSEKYGWYGVVSPHQKIDPEEILAWRQRDEAFWEQGLLRLAALTREGQRFLDQGYLQSLVLPWIDKFFISSRREEDLDFLAFLIQWLEEKNISPLILFWEDTAHASTPSFQLALRRLQQQGHPYRGIGIYDVDGTSRKEAEEIIIGEHSHTRLFALRPYSDTHSSQSFSQLLETPNPHFLRAYDSSWKDNLCFLYAGTQVFPLLSVQCEMELFPAWIALRHKRYPFGAWLRKRLKGQLPDAGETGIPTDAFSRCYALWANLC